MQKKNSIMWDLQTDTKNFLYIQHFCVPAASLSLGCGSKLLGTCYKCGRHPLINTSKSVAGSRNPRPDLSSAPTLKHPTLKLVYI